MTTQSLLIELQTEELPPKSLRQLAESFASNLSLQLEKAEIEKKGYRVFATPRRFAVLISDVAKDSPQKTIERFGPPAANAFDTENQPTAALVGFAKSCGIRVEDVKIKPNDKGQERLFAEEAVPGKTLHQEIQVAVTEALKALPIAKKMSWGVGKFSFVRPVKGVVALWGSTILPVSLFGFEAGRKTKGHPVHHNHTIEITDAESYESQLESACVIPCFTKRQEVIAAQLESRADELHANCYQSTALLEEVTAIVEWPQVHHANFSPSFLNVPSEALIAAMTHHQKAFPLFKKDALLPGFLFVSDLVFADDSLVIKGNQRVMSARLADAAYFFETDLKTPLSDASKRLEGIVFQKQLGTLAEKTRRLQKLSLYFAKQLNVATEDAKNAALLTKTDLVSLMVGEFPELQGLMGRYYAKAEGFSDDVAQAIEQHYWPLAAGSALPTSDLASIISLADKIDNLVGIFGIGQIPTGEKDPFGLRRAAIGIIRILLQLNQPVVLSEVLDVAYDAYGEKIKSNPRDLVLDFIHERLKNYWSPQWFPLEVVNAVFSNAPDHIKDAKERAEALNHFLKLPEAASLIAANKRASNILKKSASAITLLDPSRLVEPAEVVLYNTLQELIKKTNQSRDYITKLSLLSCLKEPLDQFFDSVMVMCEDVHLRQQRMNLLNELVTCMNQVGQLDMLQSVNIS